MEIKRPVRTNPVFQSMPRCRYDLYILRSLMCIRIIWRGKLYRKGIYEMCGLARSLKGKSGQYPAHHDRLREFSDVRTCHRRYLIRNIRRATRSMPAPAALDSGDWRCLPWLFPKLNRKRDRPQPLIHHRPWKLFDNLRRSLLARTWRYL